MVDFLKTKKGNIIYLILEAKTDMPTPRVTKKDGEEAKEWNEDFKKLRNSVKGSTGILNSAAKSLQKLMNASQARDNLRIQKTLRGSPSCSGPQQPGSGI